MNTHPVSSRTCFIEKKINYSVLHRQQVTMSIRNIKEEATESKPETTEQFSEKMNQVIIHGFLGLSIEIGQRTGLFEVMTTFTEPKSSQEIADAKGLKERYVREWLGAMVSSEIIDIDDNKKYFFPAHRHQQFKEKNSMVCWAPFQLMCGGVMDDLNECFKSTGPRGIPYARYPGFQAWRQSFTEPQAEWGNLKKELSLVPGILDKLEAGIAICDMGTGPGTIPMSIAERFPKSTVWGLDISEEGIGMAKQVAEKKGLQNIKFHVQDIGDMPEDWGNKWDIVTMFDVAHDLPHLTKVLKEMVRVLKPGGYFLMTDIGIHTEHKDNVGVPQAAFVYTLSLFHCMTVALHTEGGEGWGTGWGVEKAVELLNQSGFADVTLGEGLQVVCRKAE